MPLQIVSSVKPTRSQPAPFVHEAPPLAAVVHVDTPHWFAGISGLAVQHGPLAEHALVITGDSGGNESMGRGAAGGGGDGAGGGGDGGLLDSRVPQSTQSVPKPHRLYSAPGPPSSQSPSEL